MRTTQEILSAEAEMIKAATPEFSSPYPWVAEDTAAFPEGTAFIYMTEIPTPLGPMFAGTTSTGVCLLEFMNTVRLEKEFEDLKQLLNAEMIAGQHAHLDQLKQELAEYFEGIRKVFTVPLHTPGNAFAQGVWSCLQEIPYGETCTYKEQAERMNNPKAIRAIASTNGRNRLAIIIPCHRVIGSDGKMTGYAGGTDKKKWLLKFEKEHSAVAQGYLF